MKNTHLFLIFSAFFLFNILSVQAQGKCKYDIDRKDPISGKLNRAISVPIIPLNLLNDRQWYLTLEKLGEDYFLTNRIVFKGTIDESLEKGDSLILKLASGKLITCYARSKMAPKQQGIQETTTQWTSTYPISVTDFTLLTTEKSVIIQINIGPLMYYNEIKDKAAVKLQEGAVCILK